MKYGIEKTSKTTWIVWNSDSKIVGNIVKRLMKYYVIDGDKEYGPFVTMKEGIDKVWRKT